MEHLEIRSSPETGLSPEESQRFVYWTAALGLLLTFAVADAAVLTWSAELVTGGQLTALILAYVLIGSGILTTAYAVGNTRTTQLIRIRPARTR